MWGFVVDENFASFDCFGAGFWEALSVGGWGGFRAMRGSY